MSKTELQRKFDAMRDCFGPEPAKWDVIRELEVAVEEADATIDGLKARAEWWETPEVVALQARCDRAEIRARSAESLHKHLLSRAGEAEERLKAAELHFRLTHIPTRDKDAQWEPFAWVEKWLWRTWREMMPDRKAIMQAIRRGWANGGRGGMVPSLRREGFHPMADLVKVALGFEESCKSTS